MNQEWYARKMTSQTAMPCNCIGPQHGAPVCPCRMWYVTIRDGRYVEEHDLGPAPSKGIGEAGDSYYLWKRGR